MMYPNKKNAGFTLIELMVVMVIIGILAGLLGSNFLTSRMRARDSQRKSDMRSIAQAVEIYFNDHNRYPAAEQAGSNWQIQDVDWGEDVFADPNESSTVYMQVVPGDPTAPARQYWYRASADGLRFQACTYLENDQDRDIQEVSGYAGRVCSEGTTSYLCNFCVSSSNTTVDANL